MKIQNVRLLASTLTPRKADEAASISAQKYFAEARKTLDLLKAESLDTAAIAMQRAAEAQAFERYLAAMKAGARFIGQTPACNPQAQAA